MKRALLPRYYTGQTGTTWQPGMSEGGQGSDNALRFQVRRLGDDNITKSERMMHSTWGMTYLYMAIHTSIYTSTHGNAYFYTKYLKIGAQFRDKQQAICIKMVTQSFLD